MCFLLLLYFILPPFLLCFCQKASAKHWWAASSRPKSDKSIKVKPQLYSSLSFIFFFSSTFRLEKLAYNVQDWRRSRPLTERPGMWVNGGVGVKRPSRSEPRSRPYGRRSANRLLCAGYFAFYFNHY